MAGAGGVVLRAVQRVLVPARRHPERLMRIAAQQRLAAGVRLPCNAQLLLPVASSVPARALLQHAVLGRFRRQVQAAVCLRQQARRLGGNDAIDAAVQRPPDTARDRNDVAHGERLGRIARRWNSGGRSRAEKLDLPVDAGDEGT